MNGEKGPSGGKRPTDGDFRSLTPHQQAILLGERIKELQRSAVRSSISLEQVENVVDHMLVAAGYIGDAFAQGARLIIEESGSYVASIRPQTGNALSSLGEMLITTDSVTIDILLARRGISLHTMPENTTIYEQFRSGHIDVAAVTDWLLNTPAKK